MKCRKINVTHQTHNTITLSNKITKEVCIAKEEKTSLKSCNNHNKDKPDIR